MSNITRTKLRNGKYRYEIDGEVYYRAASKLYTHVAVYTRVKENEFGPKGGGSVHFSHPGGFGGEGPPGTEPELGLR